MLYFVFCLPVHCHHHARCAEATLSSIVGIQPLLDLAQLCLCAPKAFHSCYSPTITLEDRSDALQRNNMNKLHLQWQTNAN